MVKVELSDQRPEVTGAEFLQDGRNGEFHVTVGEETHAFEVLHFKGSPSRMELMRGARVAAAQITADGAATFDPVSLGVIGGRNVLFQARVAAPGAHGRELNYRLALA